MSTKVAPTKRTNKAKPKKRAAASSRVKRTQPEVRSANGNAMKAPTHAEVRDIMDAIERIGSERDKALHDACLRALRATAWFSLFMYLRREYGDAPFGMDEVTKQAEHMLERSEVTPLQPLERALRLITWGLKPLEYSSVVSTIAELGSRGPVVGPHVEMPTAICLSCLLREGFYV